jgi:hypothetical protein
MSMIAGAPGRVRRTGLGLLPHGQLLPAGGRDR